LTFEKPYLKRKFKTVIRELNKKIVRCSLNILRIREPILEFSKSFFNDACLTDVFYNVLSKEQHTVVLNQLYTLYDFFNRSMPQINNVLDSVLNGVSISDANTVGFIRRNPMIGRFL